MIKKAVALIPTRLESKRLPGKALLDLNGMPLIIHTAKRASMSKFISHVYVCTDSKKIIDVCKKYGVDFIKTKKNFKNGTERIASVAKKIKSEIIIDVQGDEPLIDPKNIDQLIKFHIQNNFFDLVVPYLKLKYGNNENIVKIVTNKKNKVIFFSRASVPYPFKNKVNFYKKHLSIISFKKKKLLEFSKLKESYLERIESIELIRALENDFNIGTFQAKGSSFAVDKLEDYLAAKIKMCNDKISKKYNKT